MHNEDRNKPILVLYDPASGIFTCPQAQVHHPDPAPLWQQMAQQGALGAADARHLERTILEVSEGICPIARSVQLRNDLESGGNWLAVASRMDPAAPVTITLSRIPAGDGQRLEADPLTRLMTRADFCRHVDAHLAEDPEGAARGGYALIYLDINRLKVINDLFGRTQGDLLLVRVADVLRKHVACEMCACRIVSDHFAVLLPAGDGHPERLLAALQEALTHQELPFEVTFHAGIYVTGREGVTANTMIDRASLAQSTIKGRYDVRYAYYTESMREALLDQQEIEGIMSTALAEGQFKAYFQPQYNHATGMLIGAEALARWIHPEKGMLSPGAFIPIFEKNGFITKLDLHIFAQVCGFLRRCMDAGMAMVPVSTNFSRYDIFQPEFVNRLESIRRQYDVPARYLRVELTESAMMGGSAYINEVIQRLHHCGYVVEMDDFGSGYSSLNVLKEVDLDIIKLDMKFLSGDTAGGKGGTILSSVVRMVKWLQMPMIAEGVETVEQADFLRSIGCDCVQGYLYSRPLPEREYVKLLTGSRIGASVPQVQLIDSLNGYHFWDPNSMETLIFSHCAGAAAIFHYHGGKVEILRVNKKYLQELGMNLTEREIIETDPLTTLEEDDRRIYLQTLEKVIATGQEQECETWQNITSSCCGEERFCIRSSLQLIGVSGDRYLFHVMIRNITGERLHYDALADNERRFKMASEQVNIYYWEYTIATREMRPCFRCMRDLGLPPLLTNYPDSAIEAGIFPPEVADMYRDWHRQLEAGVPALEAVIPLTMDRVPFRVRYTTEFDENGYPVKAYGSAALVVN